MAEETESKSEEDGAAPEKAKGGMMMTLVFGAVAALVAGGGAFFLAPGPAAPEPSAEEAALAADPDHVADKPKPKVSAKDLEKMHFSGAQIKAADEKALFFLDPLVVSIRPLGDTKHLRISVVLESPLYDAPAIGERLWNIRDILNTYLRTVDESQFQDPAAMMRLRTQIHRRIQAITPDATVDNVLITEFILT